MTDKKLIEIKMYDGRVLKIAGEKIAEADDHWVSNRENTRWDEYELYKTETGKYVLYHTYQTRWQGEECVDDYETFEDVEELKQYCSGNKLMMKLLADAGMPIVIEIE